MSNHPNLSAHIALALLGAALVGVVIAHLFEVWDQARRDAEADRVLDSYCPAVEDDPTDTDLQAVMRWFLLGCGHEVTRITLDELIDAAGIPLDRQMPTHFEQARELLERLGWDELLGIPFLPSTGLRAGSRVWCRPPTSISPSQITDPLET